MNASIRAHAFLLFAFACGAACATGVERAAAASDAQPRELVLERLWLRNAAGERVACFEATDAGAEIRLYGPHGDRSGAVEIRAAPNDSFVRVSSGVAGGRIDLDTAEGRSGIGLWHAARNNTRLQLGADARGGSVLAQRFEPAEIAGHPDVHETGETYVRIEPEGDRLTNRP